MRTKSGRVITAFLVVLLLLSLPVGAANNSIASLAVESTEKHDDLENAWGLDMSADENTAYVTTYNSTGKFTTLDVSNKSNPTVVASISDPLLKHSPDVAADGNYAYAVSEGGDAIVSIDVSDRSNPVIADSNGGAAGSSYESSWAIDVSGNYAYSVGYGSHELVVTDISSPTALTKAANVSSADMDSPRDVKVVGDYAYVASDGTNKTLIFNVSDPTSPTQVSTVTSDTMNPRALEIDENASYAFVASKDTDTVDIVDISDKTNPAVVGNITSSESLDGPLSVAHNATEERIYVSGTKGNSLAIVDVSNKSNPTILDTMVDKQTLLAPKDVVLGDTKAYVVGRSSYTFNVLNRHYGIKGTVESCPATDRDCGNPSTVSNATVEVVGVDYANITTGPDQTKLDKAKELLQDAQDPKPPEWDTDLILYDGYNGVFTDAKSNYAAIHTKEDWGLAGWSDSADGLNNPKYRIKPGEEVVVSVWDPKETGGWTGQNAIDKQLPGATVDDATVVIEQLDYEGDVVQTREVSLDKTYAFSIGPVTTREDSYGTVKLQRGFYRVSPKGSSVSYTIVVGDEDAIASTIESELKNEADSLTKQAKSVQAKINDGNFTRVTVTADAQGEFTVPIDDGSVQLVAVQAYRADGTLLQTMEKPSLQDLRDATRKNYNGSIYLSTKPNQFEPAKSGAVVDTTEFSTAPFQNQTAFEERMDWLKDFLNETAYPTQPVNQRLEEMEHEQLVSQYESLAGLIRQNEALEDRYLNMSARDSVPSGSDLTTSELRTETGHMRQALYSHQSSIGGEPPKTDIGNNTVSLRFPFQADLTPEGTSVMVHYSNGTTAVMDSDYWFIQDGLRTDTVVVEDYPMGEQDTPVANIEVKTATEDGVGRSQKRVKNPTFDGDVPELESVVLSTLRPGPSEMVTVTTRGDESSGTYRALTNATVWTPDNQKLADTTVRKGEEFTFNTTGAGTYFVQLEFEDSDGNTYTENIRVPAGEEDVSLPPSVRVQEGTTGIFTIASDGVSDADVQITQVSKAMTVTAAVGNETPSEIHVYTGAGLSASETDTTIELKNTLDNSSTIDDHVRVKVHTKALEDGGIIYRQGSEPITAGDGTQFGKRADYSNKSVIHTYTEADGTVTLTVNNNPSLVEKGMFILRTRVPFHKLPMASASLGLAIGIPYVVRKRRWSA